MADHIVPHFHNDPGVAVIEIGAREFMCEIVAGGAKPFKALFDDIALGDA